MGYPTFIASNEAHEHIHNIVSWQQTLIHSGLLIIHQSTGDEFR